MKGTISIIAFILSITSLSAWATDSWNSIGLDEQQATLYYHIPFNGTAHHTHKFGFRIATKATHDKPMNITNDLNIEKPATLNIQWNRSGIQAFKLYGHDYFPQLLSRADEKDDVDNENSDNGTVASETVVPNLFDISDRAAFGIFLGVTIGIFSLSTHTGE